MYPPAFARGGHAVQCLSVHSGLLCIDLDHTGERTQEVLELTRSLPFTCISFISISGEGIKVLVRVRKEDVQKDYARLYAAVGSMVSTHVGHPYDEKCKILTQPCFYSYDPEAYWNAEAVAFEMAGVSGVTGYSGNYSAEGFGQTGSQRHCRLSIRVLRL